MIFGKTLGNFEHVFGAHTGCQQGLMGITQGGIGIKDVILIFDPLHKFVCTEFIQQVFGTIGICPQFVIRRNHRHSEMAIRVNFFYIGVAIDDDLGKVA